MRKLAANKNLKFISEQDQFQDEFNKSDAVFICVNTPPEKKKLGETSSFLGQRTDLRAFKSVLNSLSQAFVSYLSQSEKQGPLSAQAKIIVNKSTVPLGTH